MLEVEPEEGGARDYRDRSGRRSRARGSAPGDSGGDGGFADRRRRAGAGDGDKEVPEA